MVTIHHRIILTFLIFRQGEILFIYMNISVCLNADEFLNCYSNNISSKPHAISGDQKDLYVALF